MEFTIIDSTQKILEESNELINNKNKKYYTDVLDFLNLLFDDNATNILNVKFKKITLNEIVFNMYNEINKIYKLGKNEFDIENFNLELINNEDIKEIFMELAFIFSNNLLEKLNYKLIKKLSKFDNKIKFVLIYEN